MHFAAGFGTRMGPLTKDRPKPLVTVAGRALLDHALALSDTIPLTRKVVNCHYFPDQVKAHLAPRSDITVIHEDGEILDVLLDVAADEAEEAFRSLPRKSRDNEDVVEDRIRAKVKKRIKAMTGKRTVVEVTVHKV